MSDGVMGPAVVANEFAAVSVSVDAGANSPRLRLEDLKTGRVRYLDALVLETLVWASEQSLHGLMDPSVDRWRDDDDESGAQA